jgi:tRNA guanosine-2'-O-methyltransferase
MKVMKDPMFQGQSVSAEKWIPIHEVREDQLLTYLAEKKNEGWTILGAEQTSNSLNLCNYSFPPKCVLVLGEFCLLFVCV